MKLPIRASILKLSASECADTCSMLNIAEKPGIEVWAEFSTFSLYIVTQNSVWHRKHCPPSPLYAPSGSNSLKHGNRVGDGGKSQPCLRLNSSTLLMSLFARNGKKRATVWLGYKVHFTQTCDEDAPQSLHPCRDHSCPSQ